MTENLFSKQNLFLSPPDTYDFKHLYNLLAIVKNIKMNILKWMFNNRNACNIYIGKSGFGDIDWITSKNMPILLQPLLLNDLKIEMLKVIGKHILLLLPYINYRRYFVTKLSSFAHAFYDRTFLKYNLKALNHSKTSQTFCFEVQDIVIYSSILLFIPGHVIQPCLVIT